MRWPNSGTLESWAWRAVMPALLLGGNAAGLTLFFVAVLRIVSWRQHHRGHAWTWKRGGIWWLAYFGLQVIGGCWSDDLDAWRLSLEVKSALWFFPVLLAMPGRSVQREFWWSLGWSISAFLVWRMVRAGWCHVVWDMPGEWRYARFSGDVHPTYLGLHAAVAFLGLGQTWGHTVPKTWRWGITVLLALSLGFSGSKAGILFALAVVLTRLAFHLPGAAFQGARALSRSLAPDVMRWCLFLVVVTVSSWAISSARFVEMGSAAAVLTEPEAPVQSSTSGRLAVWRGALEIVGQHPFGVGTGDVVSELMALYERDGVDYAAARRLNPHNQWLQAGVAFGWPGVLLLTLAFGSVWYWSWKTRNGLAWLCILLVMLHAGVESVLEVQRGVVFILWMLMVQAPER